jgi:hypothetical protein
LNTLNSNASLHNYIELLRNKNGLGLGLRHNEGSSIPPLQLASLHAPYTTRPSPADGSGSSDAKLTDGLPQWNMGGALPQLQLRWKLDHPHPAATAPATAPAIAIEIIVALEAPTQICTAKLFALKSNQEHVQLPTNVTVSALLLGADGGSNAADDAEAGSLAAMGARYPNANANATPQLVGASYPLLQTTDNDDAVNVFYMQLPNHECAVVPHASHFKFTLWGREHGVRWRFFGQQFCSRMVWGWCGDVAPVVGVHHVYNLQWS